MGRSDAPPIADYALIGDTRSAALISRDGSIDWLCWPRFDSPSLFAALLDRQRGGHFSIAPSIPYRSQRRYVDDTNVLETTFVCDTGTLRLTDLMPVLSEVEKSTRLTPFRQILRRVEAIEGEVPIVVEYSPRPDYARAAPELREKFGVIYCELQPLLAHLRSDAKFALHGADARAELVLRAGERRDFALGFDDHGPAVFAHVGDEATAEIERTRNWWQKWSTQLQYDGPYRDAVIRSALVLKLLTYAPSGGIIAAPTTSLPEKIGGIRNWDYRYCWLRDASWTVTALYDCGFREEAAGFLDWLLYSTQLTHPSLSILYNVCGESDIPETTLDHLAGYCDSKPVRVGNAARDQFQLDIYGEVLGAVEVATGRGERLARDEQRLMQRLAGIIVKRWREPDNGIWEKRSGRQHHIHGKAMAWAGLDCAITLAERGHIDADTSEWKQAKDEIARMIVEEGFDRGRNTFVGTAGGEELDASLLALPRVGFLPPDDPRILGTIDAIRRTLGRDELVYRYEITIEDGLPPGEGAFLACSFWLAEALAMAGRAGEARDVFEKTLRHANDVGLFSEEIDVESGTLRGNFPQGLTHIALMNAAVRLSAASKAPRGAAQKPRARPE